MGFKGTKCEWYPVEFAGYWGILNEPFYDGKDLLNEEDFDVAKYNAQLAATAPNLLEAAELAILELQLLPCKCDPKVIDVLESAINKALGI